MLLPLLALCAVAAPSTARPSVVAVFELQSTSDLDPKLLQNLSSYLRVKLSEKSAFRVVDKTEQEAQLKRLIEAQRSDSYAACVDESCQIPLGKELAADRILRGRLVQLGKSYVLTLEMIDLVTGTSVKAATDKSDGREESLIASVDRAVTSLAEAPAVAEASETDLEAYVRGGGTVLGAAFSGESLDWSAGAVGGVRFREKGWLWGDVSFGAVALHKDLTGDATLLRDETPRSAVRLEAAEWVRLPLFHGAREALLPSDRGSIGVGLGLFALAPTAGDNRAPGVGGVLAGQLDLWWATGRLAFTLDSLAKGPGVEVSVGLRSDLPF